SVIQDPGCGSARKRGKPCSPTAKATAPQPVAFSCVLILLRNSSRGGGEEFLNRIKTQLNATGWGAVALAVGEQGLPRLRADPHPGS
ncbi:MAG: hypothetical protein AAF401_00145, partial [Pseudomonadota bacterium]